MFQTLALVYLLVINIVTFIAYGADKNAAKQGRWRTRESTLLILSAVGGAIGGILAMLLFRHKTKHTVFWLVNIIAAVVYGYLILRLLVG